MPCLAPLEKHQARTVYLFSQMEFKNKMTIVPTMPERVGLQTASARSVDDPALKRQLGSARMVNNEQGEG
jgi:hypothetical protein